MFYILYIISKHLDLDKAVGQATFEILDSGIRITADELRRFSRAHPALLGLAQAQIPADSLDDLTGLLPSLLRNHIKGDRVGDGLAFFLSGIAPMTVSKLTSHSVRAAAAIGSNRVARLLTMWEQGEPIPCLSHAVLLGVSVEGPMKVEEGIRLERLPRSAGELIAKLLNTMEYNLPVMDMAGALMMTVPYRARSALFRPSDQRIDQYDNVAAYKLFAPESFDSL